MTVRALARAFAGWCGIALMQFLTAVHAGGLAGACSLGASAVAALVARHYYRRLP